MIRVVLLSMAAAALAACAQHREPEANCFNFVSPGSGSTDCTFEPLAGPDVRDGVDD